MDCEGRLLEKSGQKLLLTGFFGEVQDQHGMLGPVRVPWGINRQDSKASGMTELGEAGATCKKLNKERSWTIRVGLKHGCGKGQGPGDGLSGRWKGKLKGFQEGSGSGGHIGGPLGTVTHKQGAITFPRQGGVSPVGRRQKAQPLRDFKDIAPQGLTPMQKGDTAGWVLTPDTSLREGGQRVQEVLACRVIRSVLVKVGFKVCKDCNRSAREVRAKSSDEAGENSSGQGVLFARVANKQARELGASESTQTNRTATGNVNSPGGDFRRQSKAQTQKVIWRYARSAEERTGELFSSVAVATGLIIPKDGIHYAGGRSGRSLKLRTLVSRMRSQALPAHMAPSSAPLSRLGEGATP